MRFECECGHVVRDQTDYLPYKAAVLRDEDLERYWDAMHYDLAAYISAVRDGKGAAWAAEHLGQGRPVGGDESVIQTITIGAWIRYFVHAYECEQCGRLYVERERGDRMSRFVVYTPESGRAERLFESRIGPPLGHRRHLDESVE